MCSTIRRRAGDGNDYFIILGNTMGRWSMVDGGYKRSSKTGKYYMRGIGAWTDVADVGVLADHTRYWLNEFLEERRISDRYVIAERGVDAWLDRVMDASPWGREVPTSALFYRFKPTSRGPPPATSDTMYYLHGSFWHTFWQITKMEKFVDSVHGAGDGHEASTPGLYMTESFEHAMHYGWATQLFDDGLFHRLLYILQVEHSSKRHEKKRGTERHEVVFPSQNVFCIGVIVVPDTAVIEGTPRFYNFDLDLESVPICEGPITKHIIATEESRCRAVGGNWWAPVDLVK